jgi:head-tail adaptor
MRAGRLRHIVTVENYSYTQNDYGELIETEISRGRLPRGY